MRKQTINDHKIVGIVLTEMEYEYINDIVKFKTFDKELSNYIFSTRVFQRTFFSKKGKSVNGDNG